MDQIRETIRALFKLAIVLGLMSYAIVVISGHY
jgi:hypothetical protein